MKPQRRWMKSVLEQSRQPLPAFPWARGNRKPASTPRSVASRSPAVARALRA